MGRSRNYDMYEPELAEFMRAAATNEEGIKLEFETPGKALTQRTKLYSWIEALRRNVKELRQEVMLSQRGSKGQIDRLREDEYNQKVLLLELTTKVHLGVKENWLIGSSKSMSEFGNAFRKATGKETAREMEKGLMEELARAGLVEKDTEAKVKSIPEDYMARIARERGE